MEHIKLNRNKGMGESCSLIWNKEVISMKLYEYTKRENLEQLSYDQKRFITKVIMRDVKNIAAELNVSENTAFDMYSKGLCGGDREIEVCAKMV